MVNIKEVDGQETNKKSYISSLHHLSKVAAHFQNTVILPNSVLPRSALLTIYKSFIKPHLDYRDIIYDKAFNKSFHAKLESLQYKAALAITGAIKGSSTEKNYEELGLESLKSRRWYRKMSFLYKVFKSESPSHLFNTIPNSNNRQHQTRN